MKATAQQREEAARILESAREQLEEIATANTCPHCGGADDRPAIRQALNDAADSLCKDIVNQAELREEISEAQAEELRDQIHDHAGELQPHAPGCAPGDHACSEARRKNRA